MLMPGMLTEAQMKQLDAARGKEFDRLFLTFMIQHHRGAVSMVNDLFEHLRRRPGRNGFQIRFGRQCRSDDRDRADGEVARGLHSRHESVINPDEREESLVPNPPHSEVSHNGYPCTAAVSRRFDRP